MLLLPFLALLIVATLGHTSSEETFAISLLSDFGMEILSRVKAYCELPGQGAIKNQEVNRILCESAHALDDKFLKFGTQVMEQMDMGTPGSSDKGHSVSQFIHNINNRKV
jgi:hypothetical protein